MTASVRRPRGRGPEPAWAPSKSATKVELTVGLLIGPMKCAALIAEPVAC